MRRYLSPSIHLLLQLTAATLLIVPAPALAEDEGGAPAPIPWQKGPTSAQLGGQATLQVPDGFAFADGETTRMLLEQGGNITDGSEVGMVLPADENADWFVIFEHRDVGYVTDDDRDTIDAAAILKSISEGTEAANEERAQRGFKPLHVVGWHEPPHYSDQTNNLVWAMEAQEEGDPSKVVNYNVRVLGRDGFMSVTLVAKPEQLEAVKPQLQTILDGFQYIPGKRYAEFTKGDRLAGFGLAALVAGGAGAAAAKAGLFAKLGVVLAKSWKLVVVGVLAALAALRKLFSGRRTASE